jgi:hypothetical protein
MLRELAFVMSASLVYGLILVSINNVFGFEASVLVGISSLASLIGLIYIKVS